MVFDNGKRLCINDGINLRLMQLEQVPKNYQLMIELDNNQALVFTVAMYGGIFLHSGDYDNKYYFASVIIFRLLTRSFRLFLQMFMEASLRLELRRFWQQSSVFRIGNGTPKISYMKQECIQAPNFNP